MKCTSPPCNRNRKPSTLSWGRKLLPDPAEEFTYDRFKVFESEWQKTMAEKCVTFTRDLHNIHINFEEESLEAVDKILDHYYRERPKGIGKLFRRGPSQELVNHMSMLFGGYIGEIIRRKCGGQWKVDTEVIPDQEIIALEVDGIRMLPTQKVFKRLCDGEGQRVSVCYANLMQKIKQEVNNNTKALP